MEVRRKQSKLDKFGQAWQDANPTLAVTREREVRDSLRSIAAQYEAQAAVQAAVDRECSAVWLAGHRVAALVERRGHVVETFGTHHRDSNLWLLQPEEALYLAERATLAVFIPCGKEAVELESLACKWSPEDYRRLTLLELFELMMMCIPFRSYLAYAHLRRAGCMVQRSNKALSTGVPVIATACGNQRHAGSDDASKWLPLAISDSCAQLNWSICVPSSASDQCGASPVHVCVVEANSRVLGQGDCRLPLLFPELYAIIEDSSGLELLGFHPVEHPGMEPARRTAGGDQDRNSQVQTLGDDASSRYCQMRRRIAKLAQPVDKRRKLTSQDHLLA